MSYLGLHGGIVISAIETNEPFAVDTTVLVVVSKLHHCTYGTSILVLLQRLSLFHGGGHGCKVIF